MNNFYRHLRLSLSQRFKEKKLIYISLVKSLLSYRFLEEIIEFLKNYWQKGKFFFPGYFFIYPKLNQSLKWRYGYVLIVKNKTSTKNGGLIT